MRQFFIDDIVSVECRTWRTSEKERQEINIFRQNVESVQAVNYKQKIISLGKCERERERERERKKERKKEKERKREREREKRECTLN
jgi:hypothetical protein